MFELPWYAWLGIGLTVGFLFCYFFVDRSDDNKEAPWSQSSSLN